MRESSFDISSVGYFNDAGYTYKTTTGKTRALETILATVGANAIRESRLWVNPTDTSKTCEHSRIAPLSDKIYLAL